MSCKCINNNVNIIGLCDAGKIQLASTPTSTNDNAWMQISIPEILNVPQQKPDVETVDKVFVKVVITRKKVIETPSSSGNQEGLKLTGKKLIVEGILKQKVIYTADLCEQPVHSACFEIPFSTFIVINDKYKTTDILCVETCIEDVYVKLINPRQIFKNVTLFLRAKGLS